MKIFIIILLIFFTNLTFGFFDTDKIILAINCGYNYYYQDSSGIIYRPDQHFKGGQIRKIEEKFKERHTIYKDDYDWFIHQTERNSKTEFSYEIPIKLPGDYVLLFLFQDSTSKQPGDRIFNVLLENQIILSQVDIVASAGGPKIPHAEIFEFSFTNDRIKKASNNQVLVTFTDNRKVLKLTFVKVVGMPKLDALIMYFGTLKDIQNDLQRKMKQKDLISRYLKEDELYSYISNAYKKNKQSEEPIFILRKYLKKDEIQTKEQAISVQVRNISNQERPKANDQSQEQHGILRTIDQLWLIEDLKSNVVNFFHFFGQNFLFLLILSLNFVCMFYCYKSKNTPIFYDEHQFQYKQNKMMQNNYNNINLNIQKNQKSTVTTEDFEKQHELQENHQNLGFLNSNSNNNSNSKRLKKK